MHVIHVPVSNFFSQSTCNLVRSCVSILFFLLSLPPLPIPCMSLHFPCDSGRVNCYLPTSVCKDVTKRAPDQALGHGCDDTTPITEWV